MPVLHCLAAVPRSYQVSYNNPIDVSGWKLSVKKFPPCCTQRLCLSARQSFSSLLLFFQNQHFFSVILCFISCFLIICSPPFRSLWHMQMLQNAFMHSYFISLSRMHTFLVFIFCWASSVWHFFYILMQNMLVGVYLKLQLFKHSKWSLWEGRGVQGMQTKVTDNDLYVAHLPLPTKLCLQHWSEQFLAQSSFQQLLSL